MDPAGNAPLIPGDHLRPAMKLLRRSVRFWWAGLLALVLVLGGTMGVWALMPERYRSEAVVYYRQGHQWPSEEGLSSRRLGQRLKDLVLARVQLAKIVDDLGLYPDLVRAGRTAEAIEKLRTEITFKIADGDIFVVSFVGDSPMQAQRVTATLTDILIGENSRLHAEEAEITKEFLDAEKKRKGEELAAKEAEQLRFLAKHPEFAHEQATAVGVTLRANTRRVQDPSVRSTDEALGALRREQQRLRRQIRSPEQTPAPRDPALEAAKRDAEARLVAARRDLAERRARFTEQHPDVLMAQAAVARADAAHRDAVAALEASSRPVPVSLLRERLARIDGEIATYERERGATRNSALEGSDAARQIVAIETEWARLIREVTEAREQLEQLDSQQFSAAMTASSLTSGQTAQIVVIDPAFLPANPVGWSMKKKFVAGLGIALFSAFAVAVALGLLDDLVFDALDVERLGLAPVLVEVPGGIPAGEREWRKEGRADLAQQPEDATRPTALALIRTAVSSRFDLAAGPRAPGDARGEVGQPAIPGSGDDLAGVEGTVRQAALALLSPRAEQDLNPHSRITTVVSFERDFIEPVRVERVPTPERVDGGVVMLTAPDGSAAASFRVLRHRLGGAGRAMAIMVASPRTGEGKTTTAINLAFALGEAGVARVLLIEANFRKPAVARALAFRPPVCLIHQFEAHRTQPLAPWVVAAPVVPWVHVAAVGSDGDNRPVLDGRALALCVNYLRAQYDYIVIDAPAILDSADANLIEEHVDAYLITLRARVSHLRSLRKAVEQVGTRKLRGVVLFGT